MTKPPKTLEEIKQEWINEAFELEKAKAYKCCESCGNNFSNANTYFHYGFKAGFDCRDKLDNEALKIAVETLEKIASPLGPHPDVCSLARSMEDAAQATLAEIRKLRGDI